MHFRPDNHLLPCLVVIRLKVFKSGPYHFRHNKDELIQFRLSEKFEFMAN